MHHNKLESLETSVTDGTNICYALVLNTQLEEIPKLKLLLKQLDDTTIIYQRSSVGYLKIVETP